MPSGRALGSNGHTSSTASDRCRQAGPWAVMATHRVPQVTDAVRQGPGQQWFPHIEYRKALGSNGHTSSTASDRCRQAGPWAVMATHRVPQVTDAVRQGPGQ
ncbi:hypothetical protein RRG08_014781 [Elysia crispata]|uniref:Uncharacterized protein n=1 Tax=Elysia crispata TaxID=231223 RepID=A0AAE1E592_9GAST|nr:hypothetical protein RRG08_014781 [Elysia crispata]